MERLLTGLDASAMRPVPGEPGHLLHREVLSHYTLMREEAAIHGIQLRLVSSYRSFNKQKSIWDRKALGELKLLDPAGKVLNVQDLSPEEICQNILHWSALPGSSRHHWGTDFDVYDAHAMKIEDVQLVPEEYQMGGPMEKLGLWLQEWLHSENNPGFYLPYSPGRKGGYGDEPWHLSFGPFAEYLLSEFHPQTLEETISKNTPLHLDWSTKDFEIFFADFVQNVSPSPRVQDNTNGLNSRKPMASEGYLANHKIEDISVYGSPIRLKSLGQNQSQGGLLIIAGHHGDETEGIQILQRAMTKVSNFISQLNDYDLSKGSSALEKEFRGRVHIISPLNPDGVVIGQRANANGVDLNRNFPTKNWKPDRVNLKANEDSPRVPTLSPGEQPASEPETQFLIKVLENIQPEIIISFHSPLACIDQDIEDQAPNLPIAEWLGRVSGLPLVRSIGYETPGSFGSYCKEQKRPLITLEVEALPREELYQKWVPIMEKLILNQLFNKNFLSNSTIEAN